MSIVRSPSIAVFTVEERFKDAFCFQLNKADIVSGYGRSIEPNFWILVAEQRTKNSLSCMTTTQQFPANCSHRRFRICFRSEVHATNFVTSKYDVSRIDE